MCVYYDCCGVIDNLSFSAQAGGILAIMGENGSGKTTLLKTLAGLHKEFCGCMSWNLLCPATKKNVVYFSQLSAFDRTLPLTVRQAAGLGLKKDGLFRFSASQAQKIDRAVQEVGLTALQAKPISVLSSGQFERLLFARVLVKDPSIILLDEPFSYVDEVTKHLLMKKLVALAQSGKIVIMAHHCRSLVSTYCSHVLVLGHHEHCWGKSHEMLTKRSPLPGSFLDEKDGFV